MRVDSPNKVKDRHPVAHGRQDRVAIRGECHVALPVDGTAQILKSVVGLHG